MPGLQEINQVGKREDISDLISVADAKSTPFTSMAKKGPRVTNTLFEHQVDAYEDPTTDGTVDGADVTDYENAAANRAMVQCRVQIFRRTAKVSMLAEEVSNVAGVPSEFQRAKAKKIAEVKRDMEKTFLSDNESQADNGAVPYKTRGLGVWLQNGAQSDLPVAEAYRTPTASIYSAAIASFTESSFRTLLQSRWDETGSSTELVGLCGASVKNQISDFSRIMTPAASELPVRRFNNAVDGKVTLAVDIYASDYGTVTLFLAPFVPDAKRGYILEMADVMIRPHKLAPNARELPDLGGGPRALIEAVAGLAVGNPLKHCKIAGS